MIQNSIVLDEPFTGLDPVNTEMMKNEIINLKNNLGYHLLDYRMEQVEEICEEIALINQGKVILNGNVEDIRNTYKENKFNLEFYKLPESDIDQKYEIVKSDRLNMTIKLNSEQTSTQLLQYLIENKADIRSFNESLPSLNEIFIKLVTENK